MISTFTCPECGEVLGIEASAPARVTCPKCQALVLNPNARVPPQIFQRKVLLVEQEAEADSIDIGRLLTVMWWLLLAGGILAALLGETQMSLLLIVPAVLMAIVTGLVFTKARRKYIEIPYREPQPSSDGRTVLEYAHRPVQGEYFDDVFRIGPFISGFFSTIAVAAIGGLILIRSRSGPEMLFVLFIVAVAEFAVAYCAFVLSREPRFNGIGRGVAVGLILVMIAVLPLGACFLMLALAGGG